jgi:hypothetical protein
MVESRVPAARPNPAAGAAAPAGPSPHAPVEIVDWKGRVPRPFAEFLDALSPRDLADGYALLGRFVEIRELVSIARRIHLVLDRGPRAAACGRWSFDGFLQAKNEIARMIRRLHERVNRAALDARIISRLPFDKKETGHAAPHRLEIA